jgi:dTMP kinase
MPLAPFITFEGGEGSGKSVQTRLLADALKAKGLAVTLTREPGGTPGAEAIRALLVTGAANRWTAETETLLFAAARAEHLARLIRPRRQAGDWIICDRFMDSTRAYQGAAGGVPTPFIAALETLVVDADKPDLTLILDLDVGVGLTRAASRGGAETRFEGKDVAFHERLRAAYRQIATAEPGRCAVIDGAGPIEAVQKSIWTVVSGRFGL